MLGDTVSAIRGAGSSAPQLNPNFRYIRVTLQGRSVFLALGNEDKHVNGLVEVFYSANREVLRLQNGRVAGATGLTTEWRAVLLDEAPKWREVIGSAKPQQWVRVRDVMPGYRYGVRDQLELRPAQPVQNVALQGFDPQRLAWFEERVIPATYAASGNVSSEFSLPTARYAVAVLNGQETVVYGEQCLAPDLCFAWQRWKP